MLSFGNWLAIHKTPTEKSILIQIYLNYIEIYTLNGTIKVCFAEYHCGIPFPKGVKGKSWMTTVK